MRGGILLYYCLAIDSTGLPAVTAIESALAHATQLTQQAADRLLENSILQWLIDGTVFPLAHCGSSEYVL